LDTSSDPSVWSRFKTLFRFYTNGIGQLWRNHRAATHLRNQIKQRGVETLTRAEFQQLTRARDDIRKLLPFIGVLIVLPESIPFLLVFAPGVVPSTCVLPTQKETRVSKIRGRRDDMARALVAGAKGLEPLKVEDVVRSDVLRELAVRHGSEYSAVDVKQLKAFCRFLGLSEFGGMFWLQRRWNKFSMYVQEDDLLLSKQGIGSLSVEQVAEAVEERGMTHTRLTEEEQRQALQEWVTLHVHDKVPLGLLVHSRLCWNAMQLETKSKSVVSQD
jgi:hypothetical protein